MKYLCACEYPPYDHIFFYLDVLNHMRVCSIFSNTTLNIYKFIDYLFSFFFFFFQFCTLETLHKAV